ncbi:MAG: antitoxin VapB family protein [Nanoarchaeota archaeon]
MNKSLNGDGNIYICLCVHMVVKNISIMEDVYRMLLARKKVNESFSDLLRRTVKEKRDIMEFAGAWKNISDERIGEMKKDISEMRKKSTIEWSNRIKRLHGNLP